MTTGIVDNVNENNATNTEGEEFAGVAEPQASVPDNSGDGSNIEKQLKDTQAAFTRSRQEIAALKSHISVLEEALQNNDVSISPEIQKELDMLKTTNPELWRQKLNAIENKKAKDLSSSVSKKVEIARRKAVLEEWNAKNPDAQVNEYVVNYVLPAGLYNKLKNGEVSFEAFLAEAGNFLRQTQMGPGNSPKAGKKDPMTSAKNVDVDMKQSQDIDYEDMIL